MSWDVTEEVRTTGSTLEVNGSIRDIESGADLKEVVLSAAREAGYGKFRFYINGEEVQPQDAPSTVEDGMALKITPYDVAGVSTCL